MSISVAHSQKGLGDPDNVEIILVAHDPALKYFETSSADKQFVERFQSQCSKGLEFDACGNTLKSLQITL